MIYIASPYSTPLPTVLQQRVAAVTQFTLYCLEERLNVFSPIVYCHPFAVAGRLPTDAGYWHEFNMAFLRKADAIFVLRLPGWDQSKGMQVEMKVAKTLNIPRVDYGPDFKVIQ